MEMDEYSSEGKLVLPPSFQLLPCSGVPPGIAPWKNWAQYFKPYIRDQENMHVCWAITAATVYGYASAIAYPDHGYKQYSPQQLIDCVYLNPPENIKDQRGGYRCSNNKAFIWINDHGLALDSDYEFIYGKGACRLNTEGQGGPKILKHVNIDDNDKEGLLKQLEKSPVAGAIETYPGFMLLKDEVYQGPTDEEVRKKHSRGLHAVSIIAYGKDPQSLEDVLIIQNSYGKSWGIEGLGKISLEAVFKSPERFFRRFSYPQMI